MVMSGGRCTHNAWVVDRISGCGSTNLGAIDPPVIGFANDDDPHYVQYLRDWDEVEGLVAELRAEATKAWGEYK